MITREDLRRRREEILTIAERHDAHDIRVVGSVARGVQQEDSDLDLVVRFDPGRSLFDQGGLLMDLQDLLGAKVDVISDRAMKPRFREQVMPEAVSL